MSTENLQPTQSVSEPVIEFKTISDRDIYKIVNEEIQQTMVEISGYDVCFDFNMAYINTVQDVEAACEGIASLFRDLIMEKLLENKNKEAG